MRLKELRQRAGLTQREVASSLFIPVRTYQNWERGVNSPDVDTLARLADVLHATTDEICGRDTGLPEELLACWSALDDEGRQAVLALARERAARA